MATRPSARARSLADRGLMSSARATHDGAFMEPRGCNRRQSAANQSAARTAGTSMVRRGSTVRVRQRASGFFVLRCWFRFRGQRRIPDSTSTQRPPTSTACSGTCGRSQAAGRGCPARTRHRDARLSPTDKLALHVGLWYPRARVKLIPTASPVKPRRLDGRCDAEHARLRILRPLLHLVLDLRALGEALVALALDRAVVHEHVPTTTRSGQFQTGQTSTPTAPRSSLFQNYGSPGKRGIPRRESEF